MKINITSFRFRVVFTLIVVVSLFSSTAIYTYNYFFINKLYSDSEKNIENFLYFLKSEITDVHDGRLIKPILKNIEEDNSSVKIFLLDGKGNITFPRDKTIDSKDTLNLNKLISSEQEVKVLTTHSFRNPKSLAVLKVYNHPVCHQCHPAEDEMLGYVAMNISLSDTKSTLKYSRIFSVLYTIFIIIIILVFVIYLHVRFIRRSLSSFHHTIGKVNEGDLDKRVSITKTNELASLGNSFNRMLDNFQRTREELTQYHKKELESAEKLATIGEMAARLAHDVRNPLTGISNSIEIIASDISDPQTLQILQEIRRQTNRVNDAVSNLLKFSRAIEINKEEADLNELLSNVIFFLQTQKQNSYIEFQLEPGKEIPLISFDKERLENVLMNICFNAIQAMKYKGRIGIRTALDEEGKNVLISIQDNGPGIPDDIKNDVFKPFYTTRTEGTGLGLAIAKETIEKHDGKIWFESHVGQGTVFYISLPVN